MTTASLSTPQTRIEEAQAHRILAVLGETRRNVLIEFTPEGVRVETEQCGGVEGHSCAGEDLRDALGQLTTTLAINNGIRGVNEDDDDWDGYDDFDDHDIDQPILFSLGAAPGSGELLNDPIEFCAQFVVDDSGMAVAAAE